MRCEHFHATHLQYVYGELDERDGLAHREHMALCKECELIFKNAEETKNLFKNLEEKKPSPHLINKIKEYAVIYNRPEKKRIDIIEKILSIFTLPGLRWALAGMAIIVIIITPLALHKNHVEQTDIAIYNEIEIDTGIKNIEYNASAFKDIDKSFGLESGNNIWDVSYVDQRMSALERELKFLKEDFSGF